MAKETKKAASAAKEEVVVNEENVLDQIRNKNKVNQTAVDAAMEEMEKENDERLKQEAKRAIQESQYTNTKKLLELRKRRAEEKATKKALESSKEALNKMLGGEITPVQYKEEKRKFEKEEQEAFRAIDKDHDIAIRELRNAYPGYWSYDWDSRW